MFGDGALAFREFTMKEPVPLATIQTELRGAVEVVVRPVPPAAPGSDIFDLIAAQPPGTRSKSDIDRQIREERDAWGNR